MVKFSSIKSMHIVVYHLCTGHFLSYKTETLNLLHNNPSDPFPQPLATTIYLDCSRDLM